MLKWKDVDLRMEISQCVARSQRCTAGSECGGLSQIAQVLFTKPTSMIRWHIKNSGGIWQVKQTITFILKRT